MSVAPRSRPGPNIKETAKNAAALGVLPAVGPTLAALAAALFALTARGVALGATQPWDEAAVEWARGHRAAWLDGVAVLGAVLGSGEAAWAVLGLGTALFLWKRHPFEALLLGVALLGARLLNAELKALFDRPRPAPTGWELEVFGRAADFPTSPSFPSGHAVTSVVLFGTLAYLAVRRQPSPGVRRLALGGAAALVLLIGASRVYLGVHYPSDVLAGYLAGFAWAVFAASAVEAVRHIARRGPRAEG